MMAVSDLLPHSGAMILIDKVLSYDATSLTAQLTVRGDALIAGDAQQVPAWVGLEYMAQTIAAFAGVHARLANMPIRLGFLLGTRHYVSQVACFKVGTCLTVAVQRFIEDGDLSVFDCVISADEPLVSAKLNVYQPPLAVQQEFSHVR